ncbi:MAG: hypothetical protein AB8H12_16940 [Lewinella sp.]
MRNLLLLLSLTLSLFITASCSKDEPANLNNCTAAAASQDVADAFAEFEAAIGDFANDPSTANCEAYRREAQDYLNVLKRFENCAGVGDTQEWRDNISEAEAEVAMIQC